MGTTKRLRLKVDQITPAHVFVRVRGRSSRTEWDTIEPLQWERSGFPDDVEAGDELNAVETDHGVRITRPVDEQPVNRPGITEHAQDAYTALQRAAWVQDREDRDG